MDEISRDFINNILKYEGQSYVKFFKITNVNDTREISHFMNDDCKQRHSQTPTILEYCKPQLWHKATTDL